MTNIQEAIACNLTTEKPAAQALEWDDLAGRALKSSRIEGGISMSFEISLAEGVESLAEREKACCGFLSIATSLTADEILIEVTTESATALPMVETIAGLA